MEPVPSGFEAAWAAAGGRCCISKDKAEVIWSSARARQDVEGDLAELGVWRGGSASILGRAAPGRRLFLFDTWEGLPSPSEQDGPDAHKKGDFGNTDFLSTRAWLEGELGAERLEFRKGLFPLTAQGLDDRRFAVVHIDADLHVSTYAALVFFWKRLVPGGVLVVDDFGWHRCPGVARAIGDFFGRSIAAFCDQVVAAGNDRSKFLGHRASNSGEPFPRSWIDIEMQALDQCTISEDWRGPRCQVAASR